MTGVIKKLFPVVIVLIMVTSCNKEFPVFNSRSYEYTNNFSKGPVSLEMKIDRTEISTSGNITVLLEGRAFDGWKPSFSDLPEKLGKFALLNISDTVPRLEDDGSIGISRTIVLKPFLSGEYTIPPLSLDYSDENGNMGFLLSTSVLVNVTSLLPESTDNIQLKGIQEPDTFNYWKMIIIIFCLLIILAGAFLFFYFIRKRKREKLFSGIPPYEEAIDKLSLLLEKNLPQEGLIKEFYFQLNLIVRIYIEKQFAIRAPEQTTEEFLQDLADSSKISNDFKHVLKGFLIHSDKVKFARHRPSEEELTDSIESCKNFIKVTGEIL